MKASLPNLLTAARDAEGPTFPTTIKAKSGGVDPLGLRQINFDLMDLALPDLNNVAGHIRPFVVVTWAWRRAIKLAEDTGADKIEPDKLINFVDRIEVIFAGSQLLRSKEVALPGKQYLRRITDTDPWKFSGKAWKAIRDARRYSTAISAPVAYGPGLQALRWLDRNSHQRGLFVPRQETLPALISLEESMEPFLAHPAFSSLDDVEVARADAFAWAEAWAIDRPTDREKAVARKLLFDADASPARHTFAIALQDLVSVSSADDPSAVRAALSGLPSNFTPSNRAAAVVPVWRAIQVRQLFRLTLEALLHWLVRVLDKGQPLQMDEIISAYLADVEGRPAEAMTQVWLDPATVSPCGPVALTERLEKSLKGRATATLAASIADALAFCINEPGFESGVPQAVNRVPLSLALKEAKSFSARPIRDFIRHVFERWVVAQHVQWSVARGLADARAGTRQLLRLKLVLEEAGWMSVPTGTRTAPRPTPDRLATALSLARECGLFEEHGRLSTMRLFGTEPRASVSVE